uniref:Uncharacterized protein n=1 Tax=Mus spicilegus TaxID=10103 RepID=A0A8C6GA03_MUSSI
MHLAIPCLESIHCWFGLLYFLLEWENCMMLVFYFATPTQCMLSFKVMNSEILELVIFLFPLCTYKTCLIMLPTVCLLGYYIRRVCFKEVLHKYFYLLLFVLDSFIPT